MTEAFAPKSLATNLLGARRALACSIALVAGTVLASPQTALADECDSAATYSGCINADNLWPHAGPGPFLSLGSPITTPTGKASIGLVGSYLSRPIGLRVASPDPDGTVLAVLDNVVDVTFVGAFGVTDRLEITVAAPVTLYQDGSGLGAIRGSDEELRRSTLRDTRFGVSLAAIQRPRAGNQDGFSLTGRFEFAVPVGDADAFANARTPTWFPSIVATAKKGRFQLGLEASARVRGESQLANMRIGTQFGGALGTSFDILRDGLLTASAEAFVLYTISKQEPSSLAADGAAAPLLIPAEWIVSASSAPLLGGDVSFSLYGGGPIPFSSEAAVTTPRFRFGLSARYAPTGGDLDSDGVLDRDDVCPNVAEDRDGFKDADGCPELDNDNDRIPDNMDRCRDAAETVDGFQDEDGCPDPDDDGDGINDELDQCRNVAEDKDGFEDDDGCPELDNDGDGIPDAKDVCPNGAEDRDGFKDDDGCPDPDNDFDQILDAADQCPAAREDLDGFKDSDGCPEPDNDEDGILDGRDRCPIEAETIDGKDDEDGCPEPNARSLVRWSGARIVAENAPRFGPGSAKLGKLAEETIRQMAQLAKGREPIANIIIEGYADRVGDESPGAMALAEKRALAVKAVLVAAGLPEDRIAAAAGDQTEKRAPNAAHFEITVQQQKPKTVPLEKRAPKPDSK
ncbi:MAG: OmpA family protein [Polyangiaceae bacterium]|nr:OmpA family protein [Polyangiaceae bacterium]